MDKKKLLRVAATLRSNGYRVDIKDDLCRLVVDDPNQIIKAKEGTIIACHTRAVNNHLNWLGITPGSIIEARESSADEILSKFGLEGDAPSPTTDDLIKELEALPVCKDQDAWYPVIDKTKCTECGKCHDFCLFGVYTVENKQVKVTNPHNCKNNCPACARMCPSQAIIFPKYDKSPINGGTEIEEIFTEEVKAEMYQKRLQYRLQQNRNRFSMLKKDKS
ncbi:MULTISPECIES: ATP-binding protein [unclassified Carboxylicivirga]|uniref:ATP-binding protein n=1 Tax=Carboxylicivirga TaxID=1628153 RepID=UPI003D349949